MAKFYSLKDFVHEQGLTMDEFKHLDKETQENWRKIHQKKLKERLAERDEYVFRNYFLDCLKHVDPDTFDTLAEWKQEEWRRQYTEWKKEQEFFKAKSRKSQDKLNQESAMQTLCDCGIPFGADGSPLGI